MGADSLVRIRARGSQPCHQVAHVAAVLTGLAATFVAIQAFLNTDPSLEARVQIEQKDSLPLFGETWVGEHDDSSRRSFQRLLSGASSNEEAGHSSSGGHGSSGGTCHSSHEHVTHTLTSTLAFLLSCFLVCCFIDHVNDLLPFAWQTPKSVLMFIVGMLLGVFFLEVLNPVDTHLNKGFDDLIGGMRGAAYFDPHALLFIVLPPLLYESASEMSWHVLKKVIPSAVLLAVPGVIWNTFLTGAFIKAAVRVKDHSVTWEVAFLLGAVLSATDPVAVVAALSELGAPKKLSVLIEGESLLNDGSAVVAAYIFRDWVAVDADADLKYCQGTPPSGACVVEYFFRMALGGCSIGVGTGIVLYFWVREARKRSLVLLELAIVLCSVYGCFYIAEAAKMSGVLAVVALGFSMSAGLTARLSHEGRHNHHVILRQMAFACNQVAFLTAGIVSARFLFSSDSQCDHTFKSGKAWGELVGLYIIIHVTRGLVVLTFWPLLRSWGYSITWKEAIILIYGGLRGAVGLVMGLIVEHYIDGDNAQMITFHTSGIVLLTLLVNGQTIDYVYKRLRLYPTNLFRMTYLRKVLHRIEADCQKTGIRHISQDWFFKDCSLLKLVRCVPHLSVIRFTAAGTPVPDGIEPIRVTLGNLESDAAEFRKARNMMKVNSFHHHFAHQWRRRKLESEGKLTTLIQQTSEMHDLKDWMINIANTGDTQLDYNPPDRDARAGYYISSRSLATIFKGGEEDEHAFEVTFTRNERVVVIVGFVADPDELRTMRPMTNSQVLGIMAQNSFGFNCATSTICVSGPSGEEERPCMGPPMDRGDIVSLRLGPRDVHVEVLSQGEMVTQATCPFGPFVASELYPVVEFRCSDDAQMWAPLTNNRHSSGNRSSNSFRSEKSGAGSGKAADAAVAALNDAAVMATDAMKNMGQNVLNTGADALEKVASISAKLTRSNTGGNTPAPNSDGTDATNLSSSMGYNPSIQRSARKNEPPAIAKVELSFEPQLASDAESINELFHVFFNTVIHCYTDMHEHGILGDLALSWLTEAVGQAMDCANSEVNAMRAMDFLNAQKRVSNYGEDAKEDPFHEDTVTSTNSGRITPIRRVQNMKTMLGKMKSDNNKAKVVGLFEPMVVEYLSLESMTATNSVWDRFPTHWEQMRLMGFWQTRAKVDSLWAFVDVHEKVIQASPALERYPDLVSCIRSIVQEARVDLAILEELQPRRYFYAKHLLGLRLLMNNKRHKLAKAIQDGKVAASDGEGIMTTLLERVVEVDQWYPRIKRKSPLSCCSGRLGNRLSTMMLTAQPSQNFPDTNAWHDFELPGTASMALGTLRLSDSLTPSKTVKRSPSDFRERRRISDAHSASRQPTVDERGPGGATSPPRLSRSRSPPSPGVPKKPSLFRAAQGELPSEPPETHESGPVVVSPVSLPGMPMGPSPRGDPVEASEVSPSKPWEVVERQGERTDAPNVSGEGSEAMPMAVVSVRSDEEKGARPAEPGREDPVEEQVPSVAEVPLIVDSAIDEDDPGSQEKPPTGCVGGPALAELGG